MIRTAMSYLIAALCCMVFGAVYEVFSHEVYSFFMIYAFAIPLAGGTLPFLAMGIKGARRYPGTVSRNLYHAGIAALTAGSVMTGVLEIYGSTNSLIRAYWYAGAVLTALGIIAYAADPGRGTAADRTYRLREAKSADII